MPSVLRRWVPPNWVPARIPPFNPGDYGTVAIELDAATMSSAGDGGSVPVWLDTGGGGHHASINSFFAPPTWHATSGPAGGPVVRLSVADGSALRAAIPAANTYTVFVVAKVNVGSFAANRLVGAIYPEGDNFLVGWHGGRENVLYNGSFIETNAHPVTAAWKHYSARCNGLNLTEFWLGGAFQGSNTNFGGWGSTLAVGGYAQAGFSELTDADVAYILIYSDCLSDDDRVAVDAALTTRFGV